MIGAGGQEGDAAARLMPMETRKPIADIREEAQRLVTVGRQDDIPVRLLGGLAIELSRPAAQRPLFERVYNDIDVMIGPKDGRRIRELLSDEGYTPDQEFNALHGRNRLLFHDNLNERQIDVFVGKFSMCHTVPVRAPAVGPDGTIPLAELLLTKLQIVELNAKDQSDILNLLFCHELTDHDDRTINVEYVASVCAIDWGLWRTCKLNVGRSGEAAAAADLSGDVRDTLTQRLDLLWDRIQAAPKSTKWRLRDRVGDRVRWYEEPDDLG
jgi:hypothetical protein